MQLIKYHLQCLIRDGLAALNRMIAVHEHFGFDNRHDLLFLAQGRIAGQRLGIGLDGIGAGNVLADIDHRAPLGEARAELVVLLQALAQAIKALGDGLAGKSGQGLGAQCRP